MGVYSTTISAPASTGNQSTSGFGFTPKAVILTCTYQSTAGTDQTTTYFCQAFITAAKQVCVSHASQHGMSSNQDINGVYKDTALYLVNDDATVVLEASLVSLDSAGITLNFTTTSSGVKIGLLALGGTELTNAYIKEITPKGSTGTQAYTGVGFQPTCMLNLATSLTTSSGTNDTKSWVSNGHVDSALAQSCSGNVSNSGSVSNVGGWYTDKYIHLPTLGALTNDQLASVSSLDSDGFTLDWTTSANTNGKIWNLCLRGGSYKATTVTDRTSTGTATITGAGFTPNGMIVLGNASGSDSASLVLGNITMLGICGDTVSSASVFNQACWGLKSSIASRSYNTNKIVRHSTSAGAIWEASLQSYDSGGATLNYSTVSASGKPRPVLLIYIGADAPAASSKKLRMLTGVGV